MQPYVPAPVPEQLSADARRFLEDELARIALIINHLLQYNEDNP